MPINFPANPSLNDTYTYDSKTWKWNGEAWDLYGPLLASGVNTWLETPSSANLASAVTDETGSGSLVFSNSPTLVTPSIGVATGTSFNSITGLSSTAPIVNGTATTGTSTTVARADHVHPINALTIGTGLSGSSYNGSSAVTIAIDSSVATTSGIQTLTNKTLTSPTITSPTVSGLYLSDNNIIIEGTNDTNETTLVFTDPTADRTITFPNNNGTVVLTTNNLSVFASTTSSQLAGIISDETGSGALVFATSPTLVTPNIGVATGTSFNSITALSSTTPSANGTAAVGTSTTVARADHVHPISALTIGTGLSGTSYNGSSAVTIAIDSTVATTSGTQTLTNKTLSSAILTGTLTAGGGVGSSGQVLTSTGTGVQWSTSSGGGADEIMVIMGAY